MVVIWAATMVAVKRCLVCVLWASPWLKPALESVAKVEGWLWSSLSAFCKAPCSKPCFPPVSYINQESTKVPSKCLLWVISVMTFIHRCQPLSLSDINECSTASCKGQCVNKEGGFVCDCRAGMQLSPDKHSCVGEGKNIYIIPFVKF